MTNTSTVRGIVNSKTALPNRGSVGPTTGSAKPMRNKIGVRMLIA